jgi:uncharacterized membrane protein
MADYEHGTVSNVKTASSNASLIAHVVYGLLAFSAISAASVIGVLFSFVGFIGAILAHVFRGDTAGTWLESHYTWAIKTFWWSVLWGVIGWVVFFTFIGIPVAVAIWGITFLWVAYRLIVGWIALFREKAV